MASDQQSIDILASLQQADYLALVIVTAVVYDYTLTFSREIEYIWNRPWTFVSYLFVLVRYLGLCAFITLALVTTTFLPGSSKVSFALEILGTWAVFVFICAADGVMILRVWAMYHRSKVILGTLLISYIAEIIAGTIASIVYSNPQIVPVTVTQILDLWYCTIGSVPYGWNKAANMTQLIHGGMMFTLVTIRFIWQSLRMYKATRQWRLNQFINLLVMEGVLYFLFMLGWNVVNTLFAWGNFELVGWQIIFVGFVETVPIATMAPRFVLSMRELYARDVRGGRRDGIDTGFGFSALASHGTSRSAMVFADGGRRNEDLNGEEIPMEGGSA
ncbi:hypothetical protein HD554DRAFT_1830403 [Boletus coccyginus]|nr:hypothetical protein HD554DRAFT_1830403 [Boletus coccyginus]